MSIFLSDRPDLHVLLTFVLFKIVLTLDESRREVAHSCLDLRHIFTLECSFHSGIQLLFLSLCSVTLLVCK